MHKTGGCLPYRPDKCTKIIECAMRLHNLAINERVPLMVETAEEDDVQQPFAPVFPNNGTAAMLRDRLVQRFWRGNLVLSWLMLGFITITEV